MPQVQVYTPTDADLHHFRELIRVLKEGAICDMPRAGLQYRVSHAAKTFTVVEEGGWAKTPLSMLYHHHNEAILKALGWKALPEIDWDADPVKEKS